MPRTVTFGGRGDAGARSGVPPRLDAIVSLRGRRGGGPLVVAPVESVPPLGANASRLVPGHHAAAAHVLGAHGGVPDRQHDGAASPRRSAAAQRGQACDRHQSLHHGQVQSERALSHEYASLSFSRPPS